tara:strand:- start:258 stop:503 length:246 start_codon:yes stop_codon:yes gene_type:complete
MSKIKEVPIGYEGETLEFIDETGKSVNVSGEDYNQCDRCHSVQLSASEMYWQDSGGGIYHKHMLNYIAVCDDCFYELKASV